ncbi:MAG: hypothetical protein JKY50_09040 [Oleispira sp.]|nr:hypothetical protein [Oleispira sp.]MBL4880941.1 hypothetical protein [Oleispira sp.]
MNKLINILASAMFVLAPILLSANSYADKNETQGILKLSYSDGRTATTGLNKVNAVLTQVGVRVSKVALPKAAASILKTSQSRAINPEETKQLLSIFSLHRGELLEQIDKAGRQPAAHRGGFLSTSEVGVAPYPKVYDMKALTPEVTAYLQEKFGKLHVNSAENGTGIDEVMSLVSGGPWTWFFLLPNDVIGKLTLGYVGLDGPGWRISYPGLVPHGGYLDPEYGLVVAHAHGPKNFVMRYEDPSVEGAEILGTNSWVDLSGKTPRLLD